LWNNFENAGRKEEGTVGLAIGRVDNILRGSRRWKEALRMPVGMEMERSEI